MGGMSTKLEDVKTKMKTQKNTWGGRTAWPAAGACCEPTVPAADVLLGSLVEPLALEPLINRF